MLRNLTINYEAQVEAKSKPYWDQSWTSPKFIYQLESKQFSTLEVIIKNAATDDIQQLRRIVEYGQQFTYLWGKVVFQFGSCLPLHIIFTMMIVSSPTTTYLQQQQHTYNNIAHST